MRSLVRKPDPSADRAQPRLWIVIAIVAMASGVVLARLVARLPGDEELTQESAPARVTGSTAREPRPAASVDAGSVSAHAAAPASPAPLPAAKPIAEPPSTPAPKPPPAGPAPAPPAKASAPATVPETSHPKRELVRGTIAYVRCFAAERQGERFPCARDRKLEDDVWHGLEALTACPGHDPGQGSAQARLELRRGEPTKVEFRAAAKRKRAGKLDLGAVSKCAETRLSVLRSTLHTSHFIVVFQFDLR